MTQPVRELRQLARLYGVAMSYEDVRRRRRTASAESLLAVLRALGADVDTSGDAEEAVREKQQALASRGVEPVIVAWNGRATTFSLNLPAHRATGTVKCTLQGESEAQSVETPLRDPQPHPDSAEYATVQLELPGGLERGYHTLTVEAPHGTFESLVIAAPTRTYSPAGRNVQKLWGCFLPLYALRSELDWGVGDWNDLAELFGWVHARGGRLVGTLPMLAAFLDDPCDPSPYAPVSRLFWNELYIDVESVPELKECAAARQIVESRAFQDDLAELRAAEMVDYPRAMSLKRRVFELLSRELFARQESSRFASYSRFVEENPRVSDYAAFRAVCERQRKPWMQWPERQRDGQLSADDYDRKTADYHAYVQWIAHQQIERLSQRAAESGDGLYLDLPLGVRSDGYDVWRCRDVYAAEVSAGAPPDTLFTKGQDWGFSPLHPEGIRADGYRHVREYLTHHLRFARTLRIDHVMCLHRLYWIPRGLPAGQGVYVRYRADELYAVVSVESHRHRTTLVGENLGTVPREVNRSMSRHGVRQMFVVQYELDSQNERPMNDVPAACIASLNTHDMPPFAAWWRGDDITDRQDLGLMTPAEAEQELRGREQLKQRLIEGLQNAGRLDEAPHSVGVDEVVRACLDHMAASPAEAVLVNLEDLWLDTRPQNVPGTSTERPNWRRKAKLTYEQFCQDPDIDQTLRKLHQLRTEDIR